MKKTIVLCVVGLLAISAQASVVYDFELLGTGYIDGKDGWTSNGLQGYITTPGGHTSAGSGVCVTNGVNREPRSPLGGTFRLSPSLRSRRQERKGCRRRRGLRSLEGGVWCLSGAPGSCQPSPTARRIA